MPNAHRIDCRLLPDCDLDLEQQFVRLARSARPGRFLAARAVSLMRRALHCAEQPTLVLDLSRSGRFRPLLAEHPRRVLVLPSEPPAAGSRTEARFGIGLGANAVDCIFCPQLFQGIRSAAQRQTMLRELQRVTRDTLITSLWLSGPAAASGGCCLPVFPEPHLTEAEIRQSGFRIMGRYNLVPFVPLWRIYVLRKS